MNKYWAMQLNDAVFGGANQEYRYVLSRGLELQPHHSTVSHIILWVMVNPSVATATEGDQTITKCKAFSSILGGSRMIVTNLCAYRSQDVKQLKKLEIDLVGPDNDEYIYAAAKDADVVVCAWGNRDKLPKRLQARPESVLSIIYDAGKKPVCLGTNQSGDPRHPLMVGYDQEFVEYAA